MNLATHYAVATEWNLATLSELCMLKSSSQSRINRQTSICLKMLQVCQEWQPDINFGSMTCYSNHAMPRVEKLLEMSKNEPEGLEGALIRWRRERAG